MRREETIKILAMLAAYYGDGRSDPEHMVGAWHIILKGYEYADAERAVINYAMHDVRDYASFPAPGVIIAGIEEEKKKANRLYNRLFHGTPYDQIPEEERVLISAEQYERGLKLTEDELREKKSEILKGFRHAQLALPVRGNDETY